MKSSHAVLPLLAGAVSALPELTITKRDSGLRVSKLAHGVIKRDNIVSTNVFDVLTWSNGGAYYANVTVGTPPQEQVVILDTGSSDLYFDASTSQACESTGPNSCRGGTFNSKSSSTYKVVAQSPAFNTSFGDGSTAVGPFATDMIGIGDVSISGVQFGVGEEVDSTTGYAIGLMGIGYSLNEASDIKYPNMPEVLARAGQIASRLYSVFLNSVGETSGTILFGGVDTSKYTGKLVTVNMLPDPSAGFVYEFLTTVTAMATSVNGRRRTVFSGGSPGVATYQKQDSLPVLLDTGSAAWTVPQPFYRQYIQPTFTYVDRYGGCSCKHINNADSITLEFAGAVNITIPATEFIIPVYNATTNQPMPYGDGSNACAFMIVPDVNNDAETTGFLTLGDAVLRSMYVVFDLDNAQMSIAQAALNSTAQPNIVPVGSGPSGLASALGTAYTPISANAYTIIGPVKGTATYAVSSLSSTIGSATGTAAIPADARPGANTETSPQGKTSKGAASAIAIPGVDWSGLWVSGIALIMTALGATIML